MERAWRPQDGDGLDDLVAPLLSGTNVLLHINDGNGDLKLRSLPTVSRRRTPGCGAAGVTTYSYETVGNLSGYAYPNAAQTGNLFDTLNRVTQTCEATTSPECSAGTKLASYAYTLGNAGNRTNVLEVNSRNVAYGYDNDYRLQSEAITANPGGNDLIPHFRTKLSAISHRFDRVPHQKLSHTNREGILQTLSSFHSEFFGRPRSTKAAAMQEGAASRGLPTNQPIRCRRKGLMGENLIAQPGAPLFRNCSF